VSNADIFIIRVLKALPSNRIWKPCCLARLCDQSKGSTLVAVRANEMVDRAIVTVRRWPDFAEEAGVADVRTAEIQANQRTNL
jgi:hypothetical protein